MNIKVNARHMNITQAIRDYVHDKASKLDRYFDRITNVEVVMDLDGGVPTVEVVVSASHNSTFVGSFRGEDMYGCIDKAIHKVEEQLDKGHVLIFGRGDRVRSLKHVITSLVVLPVVSVQAPL